MPFKLVLRIASKIKYNKASAPTTISTGNEPERNAKNTAPAPAKNSNPKIKPIENCPRTFSPQVFLKSDPDCLMEANTFLFSKIITGMTKKVKKLQAIPNKLTKIMPTIFPKGPKRSLFSILSTIIRKINPTVAEISDQTKILPTCFQAFLIPCLKVGSLPFKRICAQVINPVLKKMMMKDVMM